MSDNKYLGKLKEIKARVKYSGKLRDAKKGRSNARVREFESESPNYGSMSESERIRICLSNS